MSDVDDLLDDLDELLADQSKPGPSTPAPRSQPRPVPVSNRTGEDDIDSLLADLDSPPERATPSSRVPASAGLRDPGNRTTPSLGNSQKFGGSGRIVFPDSTAENDGETKCAATPPCRAIYCRARARRHATRLPHFPNPLSVSPAGSAPTLPPPTPRQFALLQMRLPRDPLLRGRVGRLGRLHVLPQLYARPCQAERETAAQGGLERVRVPVRLGLRAGRRAQWLEGRVVRVQAQQLSRASGGGGAAGARRPRPEWSLLAAPRTTREGVCAARPGAGAPAASPSLHTRHGSSRQPPYVALGPRATSGIFQTFSDLVWRVQLVESAHPRGHHHAAFTRRVRPSRSGCCLCVGVVACTRERIVRGTADVGGWVRLCVFANRVA